nr:unnamed protein product [Digitaria exilis]
MPFAAAAHPERSVLRGRRRRKSAASKQERRLNGFVRFVAFGEWTGNAFGTLAFLWATVVLLGGYCKDLNHVDFWCATAIIFIEAFRYPLSYHIRMFSRNYRLDDQSLFRTTRAIRAISSPFARMLVRPQEWNELAAIMGIGFAMIAVIVVLLIGSLQIPTAIARIVLSSVRLGDLHHNKYADNILEKSMVIFYMLTLCQGTFYVVACVSDLFSLFLRRSLARQLGLRGKRGARAIDLYYHSAYLKCMETGILAAGKEISIVSFAIESLSSSSRNKEQLAGVMILDSLMQQRATSLISKITGFVCYKSSNGAQQKAVVCSSLNLVRTLTITGGKIGAMLRRELWEDPFLLDNLASMLEDSRSSIKVWEPAVDIIAKLALAGEARKEIGSNKVIIGKLMHAFLGRNGPTNMHYGQPLRLAAGEALANLAIENPANCLAILEEPRYELIKDLRDMLWHDKYRYVAATLLQNLCTHCRDKMHYLGANDHLAYALPWVSLVVAT